jgi:hypothetical protein
MSETPEEVTHRRWAEFIKFCKELGFGKIEKLEIQNGLPVAAETVTRKIKFS